MKQTADIEFIRYKISNVSAHVSGVTDPGCKKNEKCKRLRISRLHESDESNLSFVSRIEFIRSRLSIFSVHVSGVIRISANVLLI